MFTGSPPCSVTACWSSSTGFPVASARSSQTARGWGVHASPVSDDGPGIDTTSGDIDLARLVKGIDADWLVGGHTHDPTDREVAGVRVLNPGSVGLPRRAGSASWMLLSSGPERTDVEHRGVEFDVGTVVEALQRRRHPNRAFISSVLTRGTFVEDDGRREMS
jgi:hypothetical protein